MSDADRNRTHADRLVPLHHIDKGSLGTSLDGGRRHERRSALDVQQQARIDELVGKQCTVHRSERSL